MAGELGYLGADHAALNRTAQLLEQELRDTEYRLRQLQAAHAQVLQLTEHTAATYNALKKEKSA